MGRMDGISREWAEQWREIQQEVERTCTRIAKEMARMRAALDRETLAQLQNEMEADSEIVERLTRLREQVTGIFGHISRMGEEAKAFRKDLQKLTAASSNLESNADRKSPTEPPA